MLPRRLVPSSAVLSPCPSSCSSLHTATVAVLAPLCSPVGPSTQSVAAWGAALFILSLFPNFSPPLRLACGSKLLGPFSRSCRWSIGTPPSRSARAGKLFRDFTDVVNPGGGQGSEDPIDDALFAFPGSDQAMAVQAGSSSTPISPQVIGNAFVQQYYNILHETPDQVHKFYQDTSSLGRSTSDGVMEYVSTLHDINKKIMSMDFSNYLTEIETADTQLSHKDGVLIVVTGSLTAADGVCRRFTQSFFLAPQESGGYFVLNDVFRFITERPSAVANQIVNQENESNQNTGSVAVAEIVEESPIQDHPAVENHVADVEVMNPTVHDTTIENNVTVVPPVQVTKEGSKKAPVAAPPPPPAPKDIPRKSYASIVKVMKECPQTPVVKSKPAPKPMTKAVEGLEKSSVKPSQAVESIQADSNVSDNTSHDEQGFSVFVKSLPFNATVEMVEEEFKKFGAIKPGGIQVRNNKVDRFCYGFIEFESQQSMQAAIAASPIRMGEKEVYVEEKRTTTRVVNGVVINNSGGGSRFQSGRGVYRGDNFRGRGGSYVNNGNYRGGDNFNRRNDGDNFNRRNDGDNFHRRNDGDNFNRRSDFRNRNEFSGRGRGPSPGNGYHPNGNGFHSPRSLQNGNGRFTRVNGPKQTPVAA